jgi:hypothetical protein
MQLKNTLDSKVLINIDNSAVNLAAGDMSISTDSVNGNFIVGPLSITSPFTNIRFSSGLFKFNSLLLSTMPSNLITPIPVFEFDMPTKSLVGLASIAQMIFNTVS